MAVNHNGLVSGTFDCLVGPFDCVIDVAAILIINKRVVAIPECVTEGKYICKQNQNLPPQRTRRNQSTVHSRQSDYTSSVTRLVITSAAAQTTFKLSQALRRMARPSLR